MKHANNPIKSLLAISHAGEWKNFLFHLQTTLTENGHIGLLTQAGSSEFAAKMQGLYDFFRVLEQREEKLT